MRTTDEIRHEISTIAKSFQRSWGMGFPVISLALLEPLLDEMVLTSDHRCEICGCKLSNPHLCWECAERQSNDS